MLNLIERWRSLAGQDSDALGEALIRAWDEPQRVYHGQSHLIWLLDELDCGSIDVRKLSQSPF